MDGKGFDQIARTFAQRGTRRTGLLAALGAAAGLGAGRTRAQSDATTCTMTFTAEFATGVDVGGVVEGDLTLVIDSVGAITEGELAITDGEIYPLIGQVVGRAISLQISVQDGGIVMLSGVAQENVSDCTGAMAGEFSGPWEMSRGGWQADGNRSARAATRIDS